MRAGPLREVVVIEAPREEQNSLGESVQTWHRFAVRRASVEAVSYAESTRRQQTGGELSHTVRLRYVEGIRGSMRLRWQSREDRILYISGIVERGHRQEHELQCEERG
jgi:SPP1 family predicted phage head-tail adaptor